MRVILRAGGVLDLYVLTAVVLSWECYTLVRLSSHMKDLIAPLRLVSIFENELRTSRETRGRNVPLNRST